VLLQRLGKKNIRIYQNHSILKIISLSNKSAIFYIFSKKLPILP
jgi:hypothetical protein